MPEPTPPVAWEKIYEQNIAERLEQALNPLPVEPLPPGEWHFTHPEGSALVVFAGFDASDTVDMYTCAQPAVFMFEVMLYSRSLRDGTGLWPMFAATRQALLGWRPGPGAKPMKIQRGRPAGQDDGAWRMSIIFTTEGLFVADVEPDVGPLLKKVILEETGTP